MFTCKEILGMLRERERNENKIKSRVSISTSTGGEREREREERNYHENSEGTFRFLLSDKTNRRKLKRRNEN
jgi:hypothetical protein